MAAQRQKPNRTVASRLGVPPTEMVLGLAGVIGFVAATGGEEARGLLPRYSWLKESRRARRGGEDWKRTRRLREP